MDDGLKPDIEVSLPARFDLPFDVGPLSLTFSNLPAQDVELMPSRDGKLITIHVHNADKHFPKVMSKLTIEFPLQIGPTGAEQ